MFLFAEAAPFDASSPRPRISSSTSRNNIAEEQRS